MPHATSKAIRMRAFIPRFFPEAPLCNTCDRLPRDMYSMTRYSVGDWSDTPIESVRRQMIKETKNK